MMCFILKTSLAFAAIGYLVALGLYFAPLGWHIPGAVVYAICPAAYLTITVDPSFAGVALALGPVNASVYGVIGLAVGLVLWFLAKLPKRERRYRLKLESCQEQALSPANPPVPLGPTGPRNLMKIAQRQATRSS
jgi:hypothetical protein